MSNYQSDLRRVVDDFVSKLNEIWRRQAIDSLTGGTAVPRARGGGGGGGAGKVAGLSRPRAKGAKRSPAELVKLSEAFAAFVKEHPGLRIEQINAQLGSTTKELALPIRKLVADGVVKTEGHKRSTTYHPGSGSSSGGGRSRGRKRKKG